MYNVYIGIAMKKGLITVREAAKIFSVSPMTIRRWDKIGKLKAFRHPMNNYRLYRQVEIKKLAEKIK